eukprot:388240_1
MIDIYCSRIDWIEMDCMEKRKKYCAFFSKLFFYEKYEWIKLHLITSLFKNVQEVLIRNINVTEEIMEKILSDLKDEKSYLRSIKILPTKMTASNASISKLVDEYEYQFGLASYHLGFNGGWLLFQKIEHEESSTPYI